MRDLDFETSNKDSVASTATHSHIPYPIVQPEKKRNDMVFGKCGMTPQFIPFSVNIHNILNFQTQSAGLVQVVPYDFPQFIIWAGGFLAGAFSLRSNGTAITVCMILC